MVVFLLRGVKALVPPTSGPEEKGSAYEAAVAFTAKPDPTRGSRKEELLGDGVM